MMEDSCEPRIGGGGTTNTPIRTPQVFNELDCLQDNINRIEDQVSTLIDKLQPILRSTLPICEEKKAPEEEPLVDLAQRLRTCNKRSKIILSSVIQTIDLLEI
jgi:hypothetical protein